MRRNLLIIDDEDNMRHMLQAMLSKNGYTISLAENGAAGLNMVRTGQFDFILCDIRMPEMDGITFLNSAKKYLTDTTVIMMSAYGTIDLAIEAIKQGAYDFISKPFKADEVLLALKKAEERKTLKEDNDRLKRELGTIRRGERFGRMIGDCDEMQELFNLAKKVAQYNTTVLITGESGTGKELLAQGIHLNSPRRDHSLYAINCASIPEHLIESELFGYVRGAFTGADRDKKGIFVEADESTLFLDEIGELPLGMQVKLLRVLQEGEVKPVGVNVPVKVNVRILTATSINLQEAVLAKEFREDLFYRLNVMHLHIPPLRKRQNDLHVLCSHFIEKMNIKLDRQVKEITSAAFQILVQYDWPGNVRELENVIERAVVLTDSKSLHPGDLPALIKKVKGENFNLDDCLNDLSLKKAKKTLETFLIKKALEVTKGNKSRAGDLLELSYPSLLSKIKEYGIE